MERRPNLSQLRTLAVAIVVEVAAKHEPAKDYKRLALFPNNEKNKL
jgi:hypothetical protein